MPQSNREFELKLELTEEDLDRLSESSNFRSASRASHKTLRSIYYDTPDHRLHAEGISLRVRDDGKSYAQTVKLDASREAGLLNPVEIEDRLNDAEPDLSRIHDKGVRRRIEKAVKGMELEHAFETIVSRTTRRLRAGGSVMELSLDRGEAVALRRRSGICEAELELIKGDPKDLLETAQMLFGNGSVRLSPVSKAERGYRLLLRTRKAESVEPVHARAPNIKTGQTCGGAFAEIVRSAREQIVKNRVVVLETNEPEGAHQLRVGLTRLRSAHRALKALVDSPQLRQIESNAQVLSRAVGKLRDADVLIEDIFAPVAGEPPHGPGMNALHKVLKAHRSEAQSGARQALTGEAWSRLLLSLTLWPAMLDRDASLKGPVEDYAHKALQKRWKKAAKLGRRIESLEGAQQHEMRKSLKKLRYTVEFLAPLYPKAKVKPFVKQLKKLQDVFGYVNDVRMAGQLRDICADQLDGEPAPLIAAGLVLGHHEEKAAALWKKAPVEWQKLKVAGRFWY